MTRHVKGPSPKKIALERIEILFDQAHLNRNDPVLADRYVALAREISQRLRLRMPKEFRRRYCPVCRCYHVPGKNLRVRIQHGKVLSTCGICGAVIRIPLVRK